MAEANKQRSSLVATGIAGFDAIIGGGFTPRRLYLIEGDPGSGKTTLALQYLMEGRRQGERGLYVTLAETREELEGVAQSHGWSLEGIDICELIPSEESLLPEAQSRMFHPSEVELSETTQAVLAEVERIEPTREVLDLPTVIKQAVETAQPLIDAHRHELTLSFGPGPMHVDGDPTRLAQETLNGNL